MRDFAQLPILLRPNRTKQVLLLVVCLAFVAGGVVMVRSGETAAYWCIGLFGLGACVFVTNMFPGASYLKLEQDDFTFCNLFRSHKVPWAEVEEFGVFRVKNRRMVGWNYVSSYTAKYSLRRVNRGLIGFEASLPDTYGLKAAQLAEQMEATRTRHSAGRQSTAVLLNGQIQL